MTAAFGSSDRELLAYPTVYRPDLFAGQVVLVSGGGSGLGKTAATLFGRLGATVAICGRDAAKLEAAEAFFASAGIKSWSRAMTIRDPQAVEALFDALWRDLGRLDVVVNNAGGQFPQAALEMSPKGWNAVVDTNLNGTWYMMQAAARRWRERGAAGNIVNIVADIWRGLPQMAHTTAARAGVIYASKTVAVEWAPHGIRVNCMAPGCCESSAFGRYPPAGAETFTQSNPMMRAGDEFDVAEAVLYLASPAAKFVTGEVLTVDGGQQMWGDPWPNGRPGAFEIDYSKGRLPQED
ncbi:MAG: SDR family oxidoreductase [Alphaproteobacteria bacterium]|nr:SDR family oxidoreductase [Alphaproteobacteria bacterium]MCB9931355.1 SDR family oxidoreductase [Alphaproteobacteria bacterium]